MTLQATNNTIAKAGLFCTALTAVFMVGGAVYTAVSWAQDTTTKVTSYALKQIEIEKAIKEREEKYNELQVKIAIIHTGVMDSNRRLERIEAKIDSVENHRIRH